MPRRTALRLPPSGAPCWLSRVRTSRSPGSPGFSRWASSGWPDSSRSAWVGSLSSRVTSSGPERVALKKPKATVPQSSFPDARDTRFDSERDQTSQNVEAVLDFHTREERKVGRSQRILERISHFIGQPGFLGFILLFVVFWIIADVVLQRSDIAEFDPPPFFRLQGIVGLGAVVDRDRGSDQAEPPREARRTAGAPGPEVTLLTEQKATKLIDLLEELRRDLPNVTNRHDPEAAALRQSMIPDAVLAALDERRELDERLKSVKTARKDVRPTSTRRRG